MRFRHRSCGKVGRRPVDGRCVECGAQGGPYRLVPREVPTIWTTNHKTAKNAKRGAIKLRQPVMDERIHVFSDGSSSGACAAVIVTPVGSTEMVRTIDHQGLRNVAAEIAGATMGLLRCPQGSSVVLVSDYLGTFAWAAGIHWMRSPLVIRWVLAFIGAIERRELTVEMVHHKGHQKDTSEYTRWNARADALCTTERSEQGAAALVSARISTWMEEYGTTEETMEMAKRIRALEWRKASKAST